VLIDTAPLIYHLEDLEPWADLTTTAFDLFGRGDLEAFVSVVSVAEFLVKPFEAGAGVVKSAESFLLAMPGTSVVDIDYRIARKAAAIRSRLGLRTPDALIAATAIVHGIPALLTNDGRLESLRSEGIQVVLLSRYAR
jgi:predicted nucleic acid-binding protein